MKKRPAATNRRNYLRVVMGCVLVAALWLGWKMLDRHQMAASGIPSRPGLAGWPTELAERLTRQEQLAGGFLHPVGGLAALSRLYHANGFYNEAMQCYEALRRIEPGEARWLHLQASILAGFGRLEDALPLWRWAAAIAPDYIAIPLKLGDALVKENQPGPATPYYQQVLVHEPRNAYARLGLARCAIAEGDWKKARELLLEALERRPNFFGAQMLLVSVYERLGDNTSADALKSEVVNLQAPIDMPDAWLDNLSDDCYDAYRLSVASSVAIFSGDLTAGRRWLERAIELAPQSSSYHRQYGRLLFQLGELVPARRQMEQAVAISPTDSDAWAILVKILEAMKDNAAIDRALAHGLASCPQSPSLHTAYGNRLAGAGRLVEAIAEHQTSRKIRPSEAGPYVDLAMIYFRLERIEDAIGELKGALKVQPGHFLAMEILARYAISSGDEATARRWIRELRRLPHVPAEDLKTITEEYTQQFRRAPW